MSFGYIAVADLDYVKKRHVECFKLGPLFLRERDEVRDFDHDRTTS